MTAALGFLVLAIFSSDGTIDHRSYIHFAGAMIFGALSFISVKYFHEQERKRFQAHEMTEDKK